ncbi:MAG: hypothetical protein WBM66_16920, partial [Thiothrix litoralis]
SLPCWSQFCCLDTSANRGVVKTASFAVIGLGKPVLLALPPSFVNGRVKVGHMAAQNVATLGWV